MTAPAAPLTWRRAALGLAQLVALLALLALLTLWNRLTGRNPISPG